MANEKEYYRPKVTTTCFRVKNISHLTNNPKVIKIFDYPILIDSERDLLQIPGVSTENIRMSLMGGTLFHKINAREIEITCSNISNLQFDDSHKSFLESAGIHNGLEVSGSSGGGTGSGVNYSWRMDIGLLGMKNGTNRQFFTPEPFISGTFEGNQFTINIYHNGRRLNENSFEFSLDKSGSMASNEYDVINFISFIPSSSSVLIANYVVIS